MKILTLEISNFLAIGNSGVLRLDGQGLVLLQGVNLDDTSAASNGVGKSSIPDALSWVNFGETARGVSGDDVVNETAKKNCFVAVTVQVGEVQYRIMRYRKHAEYKNQTRVLVLGKPGDEATDVSKGTEKETQAMIEQILGCSKDVFMAAIYAGQETAPDLPSMTDKQLKLLIEEAAGVSKIEDALQVARARASANLVELKAVETKIAAAGDRHAELKVRDSRLATAMEEFDKGRETRKNAYLLTAKSHLTTAGTFKAELVTFDEPLIDKGLADIEMTLASHKRFTDAAESDVKLFNADQRAHDRLAGDLTRAAEAVKKTIAAIANAPEEMKKPCGECGKAHTEAELEEFVFHLATRKGREFKLLDELKAEWAASKTALAELDSKTKASTAAIPDVVEVTTRRAALTAEKTHISRLKGQVDEAMKAAKAQMALGAGVMTEVNPHQSELDITKRLTTELEGLMVIQAEKVIVLARRAKVLEETVKVFGPAGVRAHILDTVTPFLNAQTADYLSALSDGNINATWSTLSTTSKGELREKFNIDVSNTKGGKTFKALSGGEKRKVRLSTMLALQDLVATRASNPIQLWIGDEIDDALDPAGLERLMGVLERKSREKGTVLIISHNDLKSWIDNVAVVTKEGGKSTIAGALR